MDPLSQAFLGLIALSSLVQALVVLRVALAGRELSLELRRLREQMGRELAPVVEDAGRIVHNAASLSDAVSTQGRRLNTVLAAAALGPLVTIGALWKGAQRAVQVYRGLRP
jgi:hypothetical protein